MNDLYKDPKVWGGPTWIFLHCVTFTYPQKPTLQDKAHYKNFFKSIQHVLPCKVCQDHYQRYLKIHPIEEALQSRKELIKYMINLHNHINVRYKKREKLTIQEAKNKLNDFCIEQKRK